MRHRSILEKKKQKPKHAVKLSTSLVNKTFNYKTNNLVLFCDIKKFYSGEFSGKATIVAFYSVLREKLKSAVHSKKKGMPCKSPAAATIEVMQELQSERLSHSPTPLIWHVFATSLVHVKRI